MYPDTLLIMSLKAIGIEASAILELFVDPYVRPIGLAILFGS